MISTLLVANAEAPSVQSTMILNEALSPFLSYIEPGVVSRPPLATSPPAQPTQMFTRRRTALVAPSVRNGLLVSRGFRTSTLLLLLLQKMPDKSTRPYR